jgi:hypothetical protein
MKKSQVQINSRQAVKTATRTNRVVQKAAPAKVAVKAVAPAKQTMIRNQVKTHATCTISKEPCGDHTPVITTTCNFDDHLTCIVLKDNVQYVHDPTADIDPCNLSDAAIITGSRLDQAFPTVDDDKIKACTSTLCPGGALTVTIVGDTPLTYNNGVYSISRVYRITDACCNSILFTVTITFTVSDGTGPVITISPPIPEGSQCSAGTIDPRFEDCECYFLNVCKPTTTQINAALGTAIAEGCVNGEVTHHDSDVFPQGTCYSYQVRTFTAFDECCNKSTACRLVRWPSDVLDPTITIDPPASDFTQCKGAQRCELVCECIDLGCNPDLAAYSLKYGFDFQNIDQLIDFVLGTGTAHDNCEGVGQVCAKDDHTVGDCCNFSKTRTFTASDPCGNDVKVCRTVKWKINEEGPQVQCISNKELPCRYDDQGQIVPYTADEIALLFDTPDVFSNCDGCLEAVFHRDAYALINGNQTFVRFWTIAADDCGHGPQLVSQTITVLCQCTDCGATIDCGGPFELPCSNQAPTQAQLLAIAQTLTVTGLCDTESPVFTVTLTASVPVQGGQQYTYTVTATACGERATCNDLIVFVPTCDNGEPTIVCPTGTITAHCSDQPPTQAEIEAAIAQLETTGFCEEPSFTYSISPGTAVFGGTNYTVTVTATTGDPCNEEDTCDLLFFVPYCDNGEPAISCQDGTWPCCNDDPTAADFYHLVAADVSGFTQSFGSLTKVYGVPAGQVYYDPVAKTYSITVTVSGTGLYSGEVAQCTENLVVDACGPVSLTCAANFSLPCDSPAPTAGSFQTLVEADLHGFCDTLAEIKAAGGYSVSAITSVVKTNPDRTEYTRTVTVTDSKGNTASCTQTITVPKCPPAVQKACTKGFYANQNGIKKWDTVNDPLVQTINAQVVSPIPFSQSASFLNYFGFTTDRCGISTTLTLLGAIGETAGTCGQLLSQGVAALLNMAAFGSEFVLSCTDAEGNTIDTLQKLYNAIKAALTACTCSKTKCDCGGLGACLGIANDNPKANIIYCTGICDGDAGQCPPPSGLKAAPAKKQFLGLKKAVAPKPVAKKVDVKPISQKVAVKPAPKKVVQPAKRQVAPAPKKKTFVPGNAQ